MSNPAGRVYEILRKVKASDGNQPATEVWKRVLALEGASNGKLFAGLASLHGEIDAVETAIEILPINHDRYLRMMGNVREALSPTLLRGNWDKIAAKLDSDTLARLEFCDEELSRVSSETEPDPKDLEDLRSRVEELTESIEKSKLDKPLQALLLDLVECMRHALQQFHIRGVQGLREAFAIIRERVLQNMPAIVAQRDDPAVKGVGSALMRLNEISAACLTNVKTLGEISAIALDWLKPSS